MREAFGHLKAALDHLHEAQEALDPIHQSIPITQARTLIATACAVTRNAQKKVLQAEEEMCEKS